MNKIYNVLRIDDRNKTLSVYEGRIRDCKKSLKTIEKEYRQRGWETRLYNYMLIIKSTISNQKQYIYLINEPEF